MNKKVLWFFLLVYAVIVLSMPIALAQDPISDALSAFGSFNLTTVYTRFGPFLDFIAYAVLFVGVAQVSLGRQEVFKQAGAVPTVIGIILAIATTLFAQRIGFRLVDLGPLALTLGLVIIGIAIYKMFTGMGMEGLTPAALAVVVIWGFLNTVVGTAIDVSNASPLIRSLWGFANIIALIAFIAVLMRGFQGVFGLFGGGTQPTPTPPPGPPPGPGPGPINPPPPGPPPGPGPGPINPPPQPRFNQQAFNQLQQASNAINNNNAQMLRDIRQILAAAVVTLNPNNAQRAAQAPALITTLTNLRTQPNSPFGVFTARLLQMNQAYANNPFANPTRRTAVGAALRLIVERRTRIDTNLRNAIGYITQALGGNQNIRWRHAIQALVNTPGYVDNITTSMRTIDQAVRRGP